MKIEEISSYQLIQEKKIKELNSTGYILRHKKSGARVFLLSNNDENKVFSVSFRTPPKDHTGLPHILEHSVLCGSRKFRAKDPFVELVKGSLNTFLNAITYPDKTVYPVASCNDKDFQNLMDVYMDAVFYPNIYKEEKIFRQEGWHYELADEAGELTYNGVVYNEMKGAFSDPEQVLDRFTRHELFPDTAYHFESGGDPEFIPDLSYEDFLSFHQQYYHPANSYIYLYGDMDMAEKLVWLDQEYLSAFEAISIDSEIGRQKAFEKPIEKEIYYSITAEESEANATYLSLHTVLPSELDKYSYVAWQILDYALIGTPGAPLKKALIDAGIGEEVSGGCETGILQPYFSVVAKNTNKEKKAEFLTIIKECLKNMAADGLDQKALLAGINYFEFRYREADYGSYPKGLMYGLQCFDSWLYQDDEPMLYLEYEEVFAFLKENVEKGYFENLIKTQLLDNPHEAVIIAAPKKGLANDYEAALEKQLAEYKAGLSQAEITMLVKQTKELKEYQDIPSTKEELETIPLLKREDIRKEPARIESEIKEIDGTTVLHHNIFTSGIGYLRLLFNLQRVPQEDLPYVGLLKSVLGYVDTENYTYGELFNAINTESGGIRTSVNSYINFTKPEEFTAVFDVSGKVLYEKLGFGFEMIKEILCGSKLDDEKRLLEILLELKARGQAKMNSAGHSVAVLRAGSYCSAASYFDDVCGGVNCYKFIEELAENFAERKTEVIAKLQAVTRKIFRADNLLVSYTSDAEGFQYLEAEIKAFKESLCGNNEEAPICTWKFPLEKRNEGFKTASKVNYVARYGNYRDQGLKYNGALKILKVILSYDYLWQNLRVKGGAYGCMSGFGRSGEGYFASYRDPNIGKTNEIYEAVVDYIRNFYADERDMTKYIIGTISSMDTPLNPSAKGALAISAYLSKVTPEMVQEEREQVLNAQVEDIRALADIAKAVLDSQIICVVGNGEQIEKDKQLFGEVKNLFK